MNIRPCYGYHKWTKWTFSRDVDVFLDSPFTDDNFVHMEKEYERSCTRCGKTTKDVIL